MHYLPVFSEYVYLPEMADAKSLEQDAVQFAQRAVQCDQNGLVDTAVFYYGVRNSSPFIFVII